MVEAVQSNLVRHMQIFSFIQKFVKRRFRFQSVLRNAYIETRIYYILLVLLAFMYVYTFYYTLWQDSELYYNAGTCG